MLVPMIVIAGLCVLFGVWNALPLNHFRQIPPLAGPEPFAGMQSTRCWPGWRCSRWRPRWSITCSA